MFNQKFSKKILKKSSDVTNYILFSGSIPVGIVSARQRTDLPVSARQRTDLPASSLPLPRGEMGSIALPPSGPLVSSGKLFYLYRI